MSCVRVIIHTAEESGRRVLAKVLSEKVSATGVLVQEIREVMDKASDGHERASLCLLLEAFPRYDGEIVVIRGPEEVVLLRAKFLQLHSKLALTNFIVRKGLRIIR